MPLLAPSKTIYSTLSDEELALACKKGDELAFQEIMRRYLRHIYNFVRQYTTSAEDCDDITQDTFYKVWKYIKKYDTKMRFRPWLFTIARNTALDNIKKKKAANFSELDDVENDLSFADTLEDPEPLPAEIFAQKELAAHVLKALETVHPDQRAILELRYRDELTFEEIAAIIGKPMNTVKSWHRRTLLRLRDKLLHQA